ncbi:hypothetical protein L484_017707 [Morus notabilis]|uniref:Uncharacterized protein n=1 Tax=Morus notabilis TaxID=981085 RepID=W9SJV4_9ROSA|nr:hypothetical protein L484_017707 [Morus notabilis]
MDHTMTDADDRRSTAGVIYQVMVGDPPVACVISQVMVRDSQVANSGYDRRPVRDPSVARVIYQVMADRLETQASGVFRGRPTMGDCRHIL